MSASGSRIVCMAKQTAAPVFQLSQAIAKDPLTGRVRRGGDDCVADPFRMHTPVAAVPGVAHLVPRTSCRHGPLPN
jgi:hypothetical protein